jgi:Leucine-rich repeat (LRR) protein
MEQNEAQLEVDRRIEEARRSQADHLDLSGASVVRSLIPAHAELPKSVLQLRQLRSLDLSMNELEELPEWFGELTQLQSLNLSSNSLRTLPSSFEQLTQLQSLDLNWNELSEVPKSISALRQLKSLILSRNEIRFLPEWLGRLSHLKLLGLDSLNLGSVPEFLCQLTQLQSLHVGKNKLTSLPTWLSNLVSLVELNLRSNELEELPPWLSLLKQLSVLHVWRNPLRDIPIELTELPLLRHFTFNSPILTDVPQKVFLLRGLTRLDLSGYTTLTCIPDDIAQLANLEWLHITGSQVVSVPSSMGQLIKLTQLGLDANQIADLPASLSALPLSFFSLRGNPLNPELAVAYENGIEAVKRYLRAKAGPQVPLWEAKLILVGEGEVGKSSLLSALRNEQWAENNPTTHGIEIKPVKISSPNGDVEIVLNGWDFGGQRVYRPTHQLFFSAPAVYLVVWKPREGPQQGLVREWISLVKHRAPDAKIIVVATHGGPAQRQPDIDRQEIWDLFGSELVVDFLQVESKPDKKGKRKGIDELKAIIARVAASLPEMGREVPQRWQETRQALGKTGAAYLPRREVEKLCIDHKMDTDEAKDFIRISHRLGHLIHYEHDPILQDIVVLKPDWLSTAISFVLDDELTRKFHGLVSFIRLGELWDNPKRKDRYKKELHHVFLRLMERYDLSYRVAEPNSSQAGGTSLVAQLVPDVRPSESELNVVWPSEPAPGNEQQIQICRIVDARKGQQATAEGLFYQLIVRLHKYSLGRVNYSESVHWQRGLLLEDDYSARAMLEYLANDIRITVRSPYPQRFLTVLTYEIKWLVENFWTGLRCDVMVPCVQPCGSNEPGSGLFEVEKLIESKRRKRQEYPCPVCNEWQDIEQLLHNAPAARQNPLEDLLANSTATLKILTDVRRQVGVGRAEVMGRFDNLDASSKELVSKIDAAYIGLMQSLNDEAKDGPRLFSFEPVDRRLFDKPKWLSAKFRLTLWCEHSRLPLPTLNGKEDTRGVYELDLSRDWVVKSMPYFRVFTGILSMVVPVAASAVKLELDEAAYKGIEKQLAFGQKSLESALKGAEKVDDWASKGDSIDLDQGNSIRGQGAVLRQLHALLKEKDLGFGGLVRVQNRRQEFLWVHPKFESEY